MFAITALVKACRTLYRWYTEGTICTYMLSWMLLFNMLLICLLFGTRCLVSLWIYWQKQQDTHKEGDFIYNLEECPICFQEFCDPVRLHCGHVNCLECITNYCRMTPLKDVFKCSLCRAPIRGVLYLDGYTPSQLPKSEKQMILDELQSMMRVDGKGNVRWYATPYLCIYAMMFVIIAFLVEEYVSYTYY